jgi:hypothetical protein
MLYRTVVSVSSCEQVPRHQAQTLCWLAWVREWCRFVLWGCCGWVDYYVTGGPHMCSDKQLPPCVTVCLQLAGQCMVVFWGKSCISCQCHWGLLTVWSSSFQEWSSTSHYLNMSRVPFSIGVSPHPFHCFIITV